MRARIGVLVVAVLAGLGLSGAGEAERAPAGPEDPGAARAVSILAGTADGDLDDAVPPDFAELMGYRPERVRGPDGSPRLVKPDGTCSVPGGATRYDFQLACQTHDYGYDLLRYATARDGELGPWARLAIDDRLGDDLRQRCTATGAGLACRTVAALGEGGVRLNSWRQGQANPGEESLAPYVAAGALVGAAAIVAPAAARVRRRGRRRQSVAMGERVGR